MEATLTNADVQNSRYETENELTADDLAEIEALQRLALVELAKHPARRTK
jgi:hypothetical protein